MSCSRHTWQTVGVIAGLVSAECDECGSVAVLDRAGAIQSGPFLALTFPTVTAAAARPVQLSLVLS
jgi:hypothetical protein